MPAVLLLRLLRLRPAALVARLAVVELVPRCHLQPWLLLWWQSDLSDERGVVQCDPEVDWLSLRADGWDYLIPRGLSGLCSFPEEVDLLVYPPYCYCGLAT
jgi:hypothetical protein